MIPGLRGFRHEIRPMLRLAAPLAMAELGWMAMGFVDAVMAGRLGAAAIGAGSLGNMIFFPIAICGTGMLLGMDTLVAQSFGAKDATACRRTLVQGLWMAAALAPVVALLLALTDRKSTRLNSSHLLISYDVFCFTKKKHRNSLRRCSTGTAQPDGCVPSATRA